VISEQDIHWDGEIARTALAEEQRKATAHNLVKISGPDFGAPN